MMDSAVGRVRDEFDEELRQKFELHLRVMAKI
jgi:hypothetical protein